MGGTIIRSGGTGGKIWFIARENSDDLRYFEGATEAERYENVRAFARYMSQDPEGEVLARMLPKLLKDMNPGSAEGFLRVYFAEADELIFENAVIFSTEESLLEEIMSVAESLIEAVAL